MPLEKLALFTSVMASGGCALVYYLIQSKYPDNHLRHSFFLALLSQGYRHQRKFFRWFLKIRERSRGLFFEASTPFCSL